jgi:uncharacterized membrane protein YkvA (DUF1232 family)
MSLKIAVELSEADLDYFRSAMHAARERLRDRDEPAILAAARRLSEETSKRPLPEFVRARLATLESMIRMLGDADWRIDGAHRARVLDALAYFAEPADLIPDQIPGVGFLDDAIMVELVIRELSPELDAYADFCRFREEQRARGAGAEDAVKKRLESRRRAMFARIERRRARRLRRGGTLFTSSDQSITIPRR